MTLYQTLRGDPHQVPDSQGEEPTLVSEFLETDPKTDILPR